MIDLDKSRYLKVFRAFELDPDAISDRSIYPYAPVFRGRLVGKDVVIKRTKSPLAGLSTFFAGPPHSKGPE